MKHSVPHGESQAALRVDEWIQYPENIRLPISLRAVALGGFLAQLPLRGQRWLSVVTH